jgi:hypothetical protein
MTPLQALQRTLAAEHAAVYLYGVLGGRVSQSREAALAEVLRTSYTVHRGRRDQLTAMVRDHGAEPVASEVSYRLPGPATTPAQLRAAARVVEQRCAAVYADMVGSTSREDRRWAVAVLADTAVRVLEVGGRAEPYPGLPEL